MTGKLRGLWEPLRDPTWKSYGYQTSSLAYGSHYNSGRQRKSHKFQPNTSQSWNIPAAGTRKPPHVLPGGRRSLEPTELPPLDRQKYLTAKSPPPLPEARRPLPAIAPGHHRKEGLYSTNAANSFMETQCTLFQRNLQAVRAHKPWRLGTPQDNQLHMTFDPLPEITAAPTNNSVLPRRPPDEDAFSHSIPSASSSILSSVSSAGPSSTRRSHRVKEK